MVSVAPLFSTQNWKGNTGSFINENNTKKATPFVGALWKIDLNVK